MGSVNILTLLHTMQEKSLLTVSILCFALTGCGQSPQLSGLVPASGTVTFGGAPCGGATVIFVPVSPEGTEMRAASAITDADGKFSLMTLQPADGAYPGSYKVTVEKTETTGTLSVSGGPDDRASRPIDTRMIIDLLPLKYNDIRTTDLTVEIPAKGNKHIVLELSGEVDSRPRSPTKRSAR